MQILSYCDIISGVIDLNEFYSFYSENIKGHYLRDEYPKPANFKMHTHEEHELYFFASGRGTFRIEGTPYPLEPGDLLIMSPAEAHYIDLDPSKPYTRLSVHYNPRIFDALDPDGRLSEPFTARAPGSFNLYRDADFPSGVWKNYVKSLCSAAEDRRLHTLANLLPLLNEISAVFRARSAETVNDSLDYRIISYINRKLSEDISLDGICREFYISKPQLCRIFKKATGSTVWDYITVKRLVTARGLIQSGTPPTKAFAECGFNDYSAFWRAYRKKYGVSPGENKL